MTSFDPFADLPDTANGGQGTAPVPDRNHASEDFDPWGQLTAPQADPGVAALLSDRDFTDVHADQKRHGGTPLAQSIGMRWSAEPLGQDSSGDEGDGILVVCTGNICRSPYIERMLAAHLNDLPVEVSSAGTEALVGHAIDQGSARLLEASSVSAAAFAARQLDAAMMRDNTLILTASRDHRRAAVQLGRRGMNKTFSLVDFADLVSDITEGEIREAPGASATSKLVRAAQLRRPAVPVRTEGADVADPFRLGEAAFKRMKRESDPAVEAVAAAIRRAFHATG